MRHAHTEAGFIGTMALRLLLLFLVVSQLAFLGTRYRLRWDLTGDKLYTLTGSTRKVLSKLGDHLLIEAAWADARARLTDVARVADVLDRAAREIDHVRLDRISPISVPVLSMIGRERLPSGSADDELLAEAESLASAAMRPDLA